MLIDRSDYLKAIHNAFRVHRIVALLGPRQCGKTTLAKQIFNEAKMPGVNYFDLEDPTDLERLASPKLALSPLSGLIVIDEIQRAPELFPILRVIHDSSEDKQFLILGSASRELLNQSSESLAGRLAYMEITPLSLWEGVDLSKLWLRGGFPRSFCAENDADSIEWRKNYIRTFLEQDVPALGFKMLPAELRRFWIMLGHYHGQIFNAAALGQSLGISQQTSKRYLDVLAGTLMIRVLQPWHENISKRQVKSPKIFFRDNGIFHYLIGIYDRNALLLNPKLGASWEGFALEQIINYLKADPLDTYFWNAQSEAELDLLVLHEGKKLGFEFKYADAPSKTKSLSKTQALLKLDHLFIIHPAEKSWAMDENTAVIALSEFSENFSKYV